MNMEQFAILLYAGIAFMVVCCLWVLWKAKRTTDSYQLLVLGALTVVLGLAPVLVAVPLVFLYIVKLKGEIKKLREEAAATAAKHY